jgi:hypothetical protein
MWIGDKYAFVDWRYGPVSALRSTATFASGNEEALPAVAARRIVIALGRDVGARHHLFALCEGLGIGVNSAARGRTPTEKLAARLLRAVDRGQLVFLSGAAHAAPVGSAEVAELIETLMPRRERRGLDGQQYRLAALAAPRSLFEEEIVVARGEARTVLERMRDRFARSPTDRDVWDGAIEQVRDGTERDEPQSDDAIVLLRLVIRPPAPPPAAPAVTPSSLAPQEEVIAPLESEEAAEFSCADEQAEAMAAAARDGVPFCLECACGDKAESAPESEPESEAA